MKRIFALFVFAAVISAFGQSPSTWMKSTPASPAAQQAAASAAPSASKQQNPSMGIFESAGAERLSDKVFDVNTDSFDVENGSLKWKGKTFSVGDMRLVRARFERYLATPVALQNFQAYQGILSEITTMLSASNDRLPEATLRRAWSLLFDAAEYDIDGKSSLTIANSVYLSWRMRGEYKISKEAEQNQEGNVDSAKRLAKERAEFLEYANDKIAKMNSNPKMADTRKRTEGNAALGYSVQQLQQEVLELATVKAARELTATKAILQFQSQIFTFITERKFQQAQIACMFYRHIYRGNAQNVQVGEEQIKEMFPISNFMPTVDMFESICMEARKDVLDGMTAVNTLYDGGEKYGALQRLMETFAIGEFDPMLTIFPFEKKKILHKMYRDMSTIKELADNKDWGGIEKKISEITAIASDFPSTEMLSKIRTAERVSDMYVMAAKQAAALGKIDDVKKALSDAMQVWPLNPAIESFNSDLVGLAEGASKYVQKFDDLLARQNYREIFAESPEYAIALRRDTARAAKLKEIVVKISQIDSLIAQADEFQKQRSPYLAWDILENARNIYAEDPALAVSLAKLAPEVADYVKMLNRAKAAESSNEYAPALNYYLSAQEIFPASQSCRLGIERVSGKYVK